MFICNKCLKDVQVLEDANVLMADLHDIGLDIKLKKLYCINCKVCVALQTSQHWLPTERWLSNCESLDGWQPLQGPDHSLILYIMCQILYNETTDETAPLFDFPDPADLVKIFWRQGTALGFYTVKPKGTTVYSLRETYGIHTLDTAFVLPTYRRMGLGLSLLRDVARSAQGEDIAVSTPISKSMAHVIEKFLANEPSYRTKLWEVDGVGSHGNRKLLYYTLRNRL